MNPYLGVALGAGTQEWNRQEENRRQNETADLRKQESTRQAEAHQMQMERGRMDLDKLRQVESLSNEYRQASRAVASGKFDDPSVQNIIGRYNQNSGAFGDGLTAAPMNTPQGAALAFYDQKGQPVRNVPMTPEHLMPMLQQAYMQELSFQDPKYLYQNVDVGHKNRQLGIQDRQAATQENYRADQGRLMDWQMRKGEEMLPLQKQQLQAQIEHLKRPPQGNVSAQMGQLLGPSSDGRGLVYNTPGGLVVKPVPAGVDTSQLFPKATGLKPQLAPEQAKDYRANLIALGPRPEPKRGWFGQDNTAANRWDQQKAYLDQVFGVSTGQAEMPAIPIIDPPGAQQAQAPSAPTAPSPYAQGVQAAIAARNRQQ